MQQQWVLLKNPRVNREHRKDTLNFHKRHISRKTHFYNIKSKERLELEDSKNNNQTK